MNTPSFLPKGLLGHIVDIYRLITFSIKNPHSYTKFRLINNLRKETASTVFIETGTYLGVTAKRCSKVFEKVITIELDPELAQKAAHYLKDKKNITVVEGDALEKIGTILSKQEINSVLIFLDGHYSGGVTAKGELLEPAIEELGLLEKHQNKIMGIIIDDFRIFGQPGYPKKSELLRAAECYEKYGFYLQVHLDQLIIGKKANV